MLLPNFISRKSKYSVNRGEITPKVSRTTIIIFLKGDRQCREVDKIYHLKLFEIFLRWFPPKALLISGNLLTLSKTKIEFDFFREKLVPGIRFSYVKPFRRKSSTHISGNYWRPEGTWFEKKLLKNWKLYNLEIILEKFNFKRRCCCQISSLAKANIV